MSMKTNPLEYLWADMKMAVHRRCSDTVVMILTERMQTADRATCDKIIELIIIFA